MRDSHSPPSIWSPPRPVPTGNALFPIVAAHWGPLRAHEVMARISSPRPSTGMRTGISTGSPRRKIARGGAGTTRSMLNIRRLAKHNQETPERSVSTVGSPFPPHTPLLPPASPRVPQRRASLLGKAASANGDDDDDGGVKVKVEDDPARKIWMDMRRAASGRKPPTSSSTPTPSQALPLLENRNPLTPLGGEVGPDMPAAVHCREERKASQVEVRRRQIRDTALRNKRSIGADSLRSLVPSLIGLHLDGEEGQDGGDNGDGDLGMATRDEDRKNEGPWSLGYWW